MIISKNLTDNALQLVAYQAMFQKDTPAEYLPAVQLYFEGLFLFRKGIENRSVQEFKSTLRTFEKGMELISNLENNISIEFSTSLSNLEEVVNEHILLSSINIGSIALEASDIESAVEHLQKIINYSASQDSIKNYSVEVVVFCTDCIKDKSIVKQVPHLTEFFDKMLETAHIYYPERIEALDLKKLLTQSAESIKIIERKFEDLPILLHVIKSYTECDFKLLTDNKVEQILPDYYDVPDVIIDFQDGYIYPKKPKMRFAIRHDIKYIKLILMLIDRYPKQPHDFRIRGALDYDPESEDEQDIKNKLKQVYNTIKEKMGGDFLVRGKRLINPALKIVVITPNEGN